jgi:hypothetical protein
MVTNHGVSSALMLTSLPVGYPLTASPELVTHWLWPTMAEAESVSVTLWLVVYLPSVCFGAKALRFTTSLSLSLGGGQLNPYGHSPCVGPYWVSVTSWFLLTKTRKWDSRRQWLNKCARCTSGLLGQCLRYSFGIPSSPQALLNFNDYKFLYVTGSSFFQRGVLYRCEQSLDSSLHQSFMVFVTQVMRCELDFLTIAITLAFSFRWYILFLKGDEQRLVPLVHLFS